MAKYRTYLLDYYTAKPHTVPPPQKPLRRHRDTQEWNQTLFWLSQPTFAVLVLVFAVAYHLIWGRNIFNSSLWISPWPIILWPVACVLHEGLHGLAMILFGGVGWRSVRFGVMPWPYLFPYAACSIPITVRVYRQVLILPLLVLGLVPGVAGIVTGSVGWTLWGTLNSAFSCGDIVILLLMPPAPAESLIRVGRQENSDGQPRADT